MVGFGASQERTERLLTLSWILQTRRPVPLSELRERYGLYADGAEESARRKFERDKDALRALGLEIETVGVDNTSGYRIHRSSGRTTRVTWTSEELDTLAVLAATVGDAATGTALAQLAAASGEFPAEQASARIRVDLSVPDPIAEAIATRRQLSFRYRNAEQVESDRIIEPWAVRTRRGQTYLTGFDVAADEERNFRLDRIVGDAEVGDEATQPRPDGDLPPLYPMEAIDVVADVPADARADVEVVGGEIVEEAGEAHGGGDAEPATEEPQRWLRVRFPQRRSEQILGWALRFGAAIRSPDQIAEEARRRLQRLIDLHTGDPTPVQRPRTARARRSSLTSERIKRMLTLPGWIGERKGVTRHEIATAFGCTVEEIDAELELLELIDIPGIGSVVETEEHDDGQIVYHRFRPEPTMELTPTDALRLLLLVEAGSAVLSADEAPALSSIADRLQEALPAAAGVELQGSNHPDLERLKQAIRDGQAVRFRYRGRKDATWRDRRVAPVRIAVANGAAYLTAFDLDAEAERMFRIDRLSDVDLAGPRPEVAAEATTPEYVPSSKEVEVVLRLTTKATWILTQVDPLATAPTDDGGAVAVVATDAPDWLVSHVMAAGGEAEVVLPASVRRRITERATEVLAQHQT